MTEPNSFHTGSSKNDKNQSGHSRFAPGETLDERYQVNAVLGIGGMGVVYKVEQIFLRKIFAMKTLEIEDSTGMFWRRFQQEGSAVSRLDHPNVVKIHDFGLLDGKMPFYVMDFVDGISLADFLKQRGSLEVEDALKIFIRVSMALQHAHETDIVHRDIKPSNMMLQSLDFTNVNCVKLVDFGIAKLKTEGNELQNLTRTGDVFGSPLYMSPEQCLGIGVDHRTDIYSFGCALFEALTGSPPHMGENSLSTMIKHREELAPSLAEGSLGKKFPPGLEAVVAKLLRKNPDERYQNFGDVAEDLISLVNGKKPKHVQTNKFGNVQASGTAASKTPQASSSKIWLLISLTLLAFVSAFAWYALKQAPKQTAVVKPATVAPVVITTAKPASEDEKVAPSSPEIQKLYEQKQLKERTETERSCGSEPYSTQCIDSANRTVRVFQFPNQISIGQLKMDNLNRYAAQGDVLVAEPGSFKLSPSYECCARPSLLDGFRPDEIGELNISQVESAKNDVLSHLDKWKNMKILVIDDAEINDRGLSYLPENAPIIDFRTSDSAVTGNGIAALKCLNNLENIDADALPNCTNLLKALSGSKSLQRLSLRGCRLTDDDLKNLTPITSLRSIDISENKEITDAGIQHLTLPKLRGLAIRKCKVTEASFPFLKTLPSLVNVIIGADWSVQKKECFHKILPQARLLSDSDLHHALDVEPSR